MEKSHESIVFRYLKTILRFAIRLEPQRVTRTHSLSPFLSLSLSFSVSHTLLSFLPLSSVLQLTLSISPFHKPFSFSVSSHQLHRSRKGSFSKSKMAVTRPKGQFALRTQTRPLVGSEPPLLLLLLLFQLRLSSSLAMLKKTSKRFFLLADLARFLDELERCRSQA